MRILSLQSLRLNAVLGIGLIAVTLWMVGQPLICTCGTVKFWVGSVFDSGNSQHIADWYTLSHFLHGVLVVMVARLFFPQVSANTVFAVAIATGVGWEIIEHMTWVLDMFRSTTINAGYQGYSVVNAVSDYLWMMLGFFTARALPTLYVALMVLALELTAALFARDSLILTTLMLIYPVEAVEEWQQEINPNRVVHVDMDLGTDLETNG